MRRLRGPLRAVRRAPSDGRPLHLCSRSAAGPRAKIGVPRWTTTTSRPRPTCACCSRAPEVKFKDATAPRQLAARGQVPSRNSAPTCARPRGSSRSCISAYSTPFEPGMRKCDLVAVGRGLGDLRRRHPPARPPRNRRPTYPRASWPLLPIGRGRRRPAHLTWGTGPPDEDRRGHVLSRSPAA